MDIVIHGPDIPMKLGEDEKTSVSKGRLGYYPQEVDFKRNVKAKKILVCWSK